MTAIATRKISKTPRLSEEPAANPEAAVKETIAKTRIASVTQTDRSRAPKPCDCCLHTQREALITIAKRTKRSITLSVIPMAGGFYAPRRNKSKILMEPPGFIPGPHFEFYCFG